MYNKMSKEPRSSDSPTSTSDSTESTSVSVETIVDCNPQSNDQQIIEKQTAAMTHSTNATNNYNKNSLTNSQISMISSDDQKDTSPIYNSPEHLLPEKTSKQVFSSTIDEKSIMNAPQLPQKLEGSKPTKRKKSSDFPKHILFGIIQFALSIALVALGGLQLVRGASMATTGCGIWSGAIAAIAGALCVINMKSAQTGFLAVSLICVASGTLATALVGSGLVRDINRLEQEESNHEAIKAAISASSGLVFALALHILVSIASVYHSAIKLCSRGNSSQMLDNVINVNNASMAGEQQKAEEYFNSLNRSTHTRGKMIPPENADKLMAMWMYTAKHGAHHHQQHHQQHHQHHHSGKSGVTQASSRPIMLVPAGNGVMPHMGYRPSPAVMMPPTMMPGSISLPYGGLPVQVLPTTAPLHPDEIKALYKLRTTQKPTSDMGKNCHHQTQQRRTGKNEASKRQRRRSESDVAENRRAFTYTGLDRAIADSFLKQQEQSNGSHTSYSSEDSIKYGDQEVSV